MLADITALFCGFGLVGYVQGGLAGGQNALLFAQLLLPVYLTVALYDDVYSLDSLRRANRGAVRAVLSLTIAVAVVFFIIFYAAIEQKFSRYIVTAGGATTVALLVALRLTVLQALVSWRCGASVVNELVIDDGGPALSLPGSYHVSASAFGLVPSLTDPNAMDRIGMVLRNADRVIVSSPPERRADWAMVLRGANVAGEVIDDAVSAMMATGARIAEGHGLLLVSEGPLGMRARLVKRLLDITVAGLALIALAPLLLVVAAMIKLEDGGPVFFRQRRVGRSNRYFAMYKFRSMRENKAGRNGSVLTAKNDSRITRIGKFIRATSIDELPQLLNVLSGDMSIVGPRPHATGALAGDKLYWEVDARYWQRHALRPGLTGLAQVRGYRGTTDHEEDLALRLQADLEYLSGWSLWRDIWIMLATVKVLVHSNAY
ncbi:exopolysaccharide biosynthesis polyprenyl glycosylphosphotransferase [Novosphingobium ovatum]|nr:exopolysaccharide biosynthesis polyprenyl glycosylphosphotransferase [Novosphingobium ovatum]